MLELRRSRPYGAAAVEIELAKRRVSPLPSESAVYRGLARAGMMIPACGMARSGNAGSAPLLWQMDVVGGFPIADGISAKVLTGIDGHSRMCFCAKVIARERTQAVCEGLRAAPGTFGAPEQILSDNGKVFTARFHPPVEVLFDAVCRERGIEHL